MREIRIAGPWTLVELPGHGPLAPDDLAAVLAAQPGTPGLRAWTVPEMPAVVHEVLEHHGEIESPWKAGAAQACSWVAERDWVYRAEFPADAGQPGPVSLRCGGADTIVDVYLNGQKVGSHESMYVPFRFAVTGFLAESNVVLVHVRSVFRPATEGGEPYRFVDDDPTRPVRRSKHNYGTYLGPHPYFSRVGVFGAVTLNDESDGEIEACTVQTRLSPDLNTARVTVRCRGAAPPGASIVVAVEDPDGAPSVSRDLDVATPSAASGGNGRLTAFDEELEIDIRRPLLWWPRGYGEQPLYRLSATLTEPAGARSIDRCDRTIGFRRIETPSPMHFTVNGVPVRLWGANWVAPDWVTPAWNAEKASLLLDRAEHAHMNTLRVWGEVESPDDAFYEMADERGFLVWQDFTDMPVEPTEINREIARREAAALVERLQHHPSIFLWCGKNEAAMWHDFSRSGEPFAGRVILEDDVGGVVQRLDPDRPYLPSSPYYGYDANDPGDHNTHGYTNMWFVHGYDYLVFATEDTRISAPPVSTLRRIVAPDHLWPADFSPLHTPDSPLPWPATWMGYTGSTSERKVGPIERFYDPVDPESLVYRLGAAAGDYYRDTIERQRRGRPAGDTSGVRRCGGYLVWKLDDSWPQIYSAKVGYFGEPYQVYYAVRRAFAPLLVSVDVGSRIHVWIVNDTRERVDATLTVTAFRMDTDDLTATLSRSVSVAPGASSPVAELTEFGTLDRHNVIHAAIAAGNGTRLADSIALLDHERSLPFPPAQLELACVDGVLHVRSDRFARSVVLTGDEDETDWFFEDNYFDLVPGETRSIRVETARERGTVSARAFYSPHRTSVEFTRPPVS